MKKEVIACDFLDHAKGKECRKFAESVCALCNKDGCDEHLIMALALTFGTISPPKSSDPQTQSTEARHPTQALTRRRPLCLDCNMQICRLLAGYDDLVRPVDTVENMLQTLIDETKALLAEKALRAMGPPR